jgi:glycerophosphoryl diester phosphodiesterase
VPQGLPPLTELIAVRRGGAPLIGAHRGGATYAPENTLAAFGEGIRRGADMLELDVHLSRDRQLVVIHDHAVERTTDGRGYVHDLTLAELRRPDAGAWFAPRFVAGRAYLTVELKGLPRDWPTLPDAVVELLDRTGLVRHALLISFDHRHVLRAKGRNPALKAAINYSARLLDPLHAGRAARADVLNQPWLYCDREFCDLAHAHGFAVQCFAPSPAVAWDLARNGVDILDTDEPDAVKAATRPGAPRPDAPPSAFA